MKRYVDRLTYQECLAAGGARIDLDGNVAGVERAVLPRREDGRIKARQSAEAAAVKAEAEYAVS